MKQDKKKQVIGWIAVGISTIVTCFWAFWGIIENFHEGWYYETLISNVGLMIFQYLSPMLVFLVITLISITWPRLGGLLHFAFALFAIWFFQAFSNPGMFLLIAPLVGLGVLYWFARPEPRKVALLLVLALPLLTLIIAGIEPVLRVSQRFNDDNLQARSVQGNGVTLVWAPDGPGWPRTGANWEEAQQVCEFLSEDGMTIEINQLNIWRLPSVDEAVRSMTRQGTNSVGEWDAQTQLTSYKTKPDKESPLWNIHSQVIYWWTATEIDEARAYIIVYDGKVWSRSKQLNQAYIGFRCVKQP